jgi:hypothetical protein
MNTYKRTYNATLNINISSPKNIDLLKKMLQVYDMQELLGIQVTEDFGDHHDEEELLEKYGLNNYKIKEELVIKIPIS